MSHDLARKTPDELLRELQAEEEAAVVKGHLKIFLGYTSGVGKSFRMLDEARRRRERGQDVVVGAVQPKVTPEVAALLGKLEVIPLRSCAEGTAMDVDAISRRHPAVCFIDGLAYDNPPGLRNPTRWQDVQGLVKSGIKVIGSINIQYIKELRFQVQAITGKCVSQVVPISFIKSADEIEIVDAPPEQPLERTPEEKEDAEIRAQRLSKLRELALVLAADVVEYQLADYLKRHGIKQHFATRERILVCMTPRANIHEMLQTAQIIAAKFHAETVVAYVKQPDLAVADQNALEAKLAAFQGAGIPIQILEGADAVETLFEFAKSRGITQLFIGHTQQSSLWSRILGDPVDKLIRRSQGMDVRIFPQ
jgi:two-component system, OmpR family, sensor histidine kinase KdpD